MISVQKDVDLNTIKLCVEDGRIVRVKDLVPENKKVTTDKQKGFYFFVVVFALCVIFSCSYIRIKIRHGTDSAEMYASTNSAHPAQNVPYSFIERKTCNATAIF